MSTEELNEQDGETTPDGDAAVVDEEVELAKEAVKRAKAVGMTIEEYHQAAAYGTQARAREESKMFDERAKEKPDPDEPVTRRQMEQQLRDRELDLLARTHKLSKAQAFAIAATVNKTMEVTPGQEIADIYPDAVAAVCGRRQAAAVEDDRTAGQVTQAAARVATRQPNTGSGKSVVKTDDECPYDIGDERHEAWAKKELKRMFSEATEE